MGYSDLSLAMAFFIGAFHAFFPGHGKALMAAYLVGSRGRIIDAVWLGLVVGITHTFSVIVLAVVIKVSFSAVMTVVIEQQETPGTAPVPVPGIKIIRLVAGILVLSVGVWLIVNRRRIIAHQHYDPGRINGRSIWHTIILGALGGMIPCANGIAILLIAISEGQVGRGLTLVLAFSIGVAITIISVAIIICRLTSVAERLLQRTGRWVDKLPVLSGFLIVLLGCYSVVRVLLTF